MQECKNAAMKERGHVTMKNTGLFASCRVRRVPAVAFLRCCILAFLVFLSRAVSAEVIDRVLAVVAGSIITLTDVTAARELGFESPGTAADPTGAVLAKLIDRELILAEVDRYAPPEPTADAVDRELDAIRARFPTAERFETALARSGRDAARLRETVRENLRIRAYEAQRFTAAVPTDDDLGAYYRAHQDAFTRDGRVLPFETARAAVAERVTAERSAALIDDWVSGLRRRADVINLYLAQRTR